MPSSKKPTWRRLVVYAAVAVFLVLADPRTPTLEIGLGIVALGEVLRLWAAGHLVKNRELTVTGPYAHVRNPLYVGTLLVLLGFGIAGSSLEFPGTLVAFAVLPLALAAFFAAYVPRKRRIEEDRLARRFGAAAAAYVAAVPALWPRLTPARLGPSDAPEDRAFSIERVQANSEHLTVVAIALGAAALFAKRAWSAGP